VAAVALAGAEAVVVAAAVEVVAVVVVAAAVEVVTKLLHQVAAAVIRPLLHLVMAVGEVVVGEVVARLALIHRRLALHCIQTAI
jgi:hypothetical protein